MPMDEIERVKQQAERVKEQVDRLTRYVEGTDSRPGLIAIVDDLREDVYGSERRKENGGMLHVVRELEKRSLRQDTTLRVLMVVVGILVPPSATGLAALARVFFGGN